MNKIDIISSPELNLNAKVALVDIMNRHNKSELCSVCEEIIQIMSLSDEEIKKDMAELQIDIASSTNDVDSLRSTIYDLQDDIKETRTKLHSYSHMFKSVEEINENTRELIKLRAEFVQDRNDLSNKIESLTTIIGNLIKYIDTKKTINMRKEPKKPKIICNELQQIQKDIDEYKK